MNAKIRKAEVHDYPAIRELLLQAQLPLDGVKEHLNNFLVLAIDGELCGTVGLEIYGDRALLRSLAVRQGLRGKGFGIQLYQGIIERARDRRLSEIYLLTETAEKFFARQGFEKISREAVDKRVKTSLEFQTACPASAACMRMRLE